MKVFAYEHITGGGLSGETLSSSLAHEGDMMSHALMADLASVPGVEVITLRDQRLPQLDLPVTSFAVSNLHDLQASFDDCIMQADAVWLVAPESGGVLERLSRQVIGRHRILLGSQPDAVHLTSSKLQTVRVLQAAGVPAARTYYPDAPMPDDAHAWVVKPDDGAGCADTRIFPDRAQALAWVEKNQHRARFVMQPYIAGEACSLSMLCRNGKSRVLSCNRQRVAVRDNQFFYLGSVVNSIADSQGQFARIAQQIASAIPGLWGYVGVDIILTAQGPVVLEVNPRLTTSYAGLHESINYNPAQLVMGLLTLPFPQIEPALKTHTVNVDVEPFSVH